MARGTKATAIAKSRPPFTGRERLGTRKTRMAGLEHDCRRLPADGVSENTIFPLVNGLCNRPGTKLTH
jgi:hypothetical protein